MYGHGGHLGHVTQLRRANFRPPPPPPAPPTNWVSTWNLALFGPVVSEKKTFEECGRRTDDGACLYYKLIYEPKGPEELITFQVKDTWRSMSSSEGYMAVYKFKWRIHGGLWVPQQRRFRYGSGTEIIVKKYPSKWRVHGGLRAPQQGRYQYVWFRNRNHC